MRDQQSHGTQSRFNSTRLRSHVIVITGKSNHARGESSLRHQEFSSQEKLHRIFSSADLF
jgi:hypothetical protein